MTYEVCEPMWVRILMEELRLRSNASMKLYYDKKAATDIAHDPIQHTQRSTLR